MLADSGAEAKAVTLLNVGQDTVNRLGRLLRARHTFDFLECGLAFSNESETESLERGEQALFGHFTDPFDRGTFHDQVTNAIVDLKQFEECSSAMETRLQASSTALRRINFGQSADTLSHAERLRRCGCHRFAAVGAEQSDQSLRHDEIKRIRYQGSINSQIKEAEDRADGVFRMNCGVHEMTSHGGLHRNSCSFNIADLADKDDVRILPEHGTQNTVKRRPLAMVDRNLRTSLKVVLDWILDGDRIALFDIDFTQA